MIFHVSTNYLSAPLRFDVKFCLDRTNVGMFLDFKRVFLYLFGVAVIIFFSEFHSISADINHFRLFRL